MSELTVQINDFEVKLRTVDTPKRRNADKTIIELTSFVRDLSQKIDKLEDPD